MHIFQTNITDKCIFAEDLICINAYFPGFEDGWLQLLLRDSGKRPRCPVLYSAQIYITNLYINLLYYEKR